MLDARCSILGAMVEERESWGGGEAKTNKQTDRRTAKSLRKHVTASSGFHGTMEQGEALSVTHQPLLLPQDEVMAKVT